MRPVLILGAEPRVAVPIARSLAGHGIPVDVAALSMRAPGLRSRAIRTVLRLPNHSDRPADFIDTLSRYIDRERVDMLMPTSDTALALVAQHYERLTSLLHLACPPPEVIHRVLDKDQTLDVARRCGIEVPATCLMAASSDVDEIVARLRFPVVVKARSKTHVPPNAFKVRYFTEATALKEQFTRDPHFGADNLLQEYCPGEGVGLGILMHRGTIVTAFQHRRVKELPSTGGVGVLAVSERPDPRLIEMSQRLLRALEWEGVAMVEFRHDRANDRAVLMEVNGRYWGSCSFAIRAGIHLPVYQWQLAHDRRPDVAASYRAGLRWRWTSGYAERLSRLITDPPIEGMARPSVWADVLRSAADFTPSTVSALGSVRDPVPAVSELSRTLVDLLKIHVKRGIRAIAPRGLLRLRQTYQRLGRRDGRAYVKLQLLHVLGMRSPKRGGRPTPIRSVLFVCHGNIIRSPMAAALLTKHLGAVNGNAVSVSSAGVHAKPGRQADSRALDAATAFDVSLSDHRAQPLTAELIEETDLILVMDRVNEAELVGAYPHAIDKVFLLRSYVGGGTRTAAEVADPYTGTMNDVRECYAALEQNIRALVDSDFRGSSRRA